MIGLVTVSAASLIANPFSKQYTIALRDISLNGDLLLACPLKKLPLGAAFGAEIWLEHKLETLDYGEVRSRFILHPFETGVFRRDPGSWRWSRPGGGEVVFQTQDEEKNPRGLRKPQGWGRLVKASKFRCYVQNAVQLWTTDSGQQIVCDDGWELYYHDGSLELILAPDTSQWSVASSGKYITSIKAGDTEVASIRWRQSGMPEDATIGITAYSFHWAPGLLLSKVSNEDGDLFTFAYHANNLLRELRRPNADPVPFQWREMVGSPSTGASLPYVLVKAGETEYTYKNHKGHISIDACSTAGKKEALEIVMRYGRILSIKQK
jgi:hypothetical protein